MFSGHQASNHFLRKSEPYDQLIKLLLIGNSGVGKSSILLRYSNDEFCTSFISTIGIDFKIKTLDVDGQRVKMQIWDTAGQERFRTITTAYYRGAMGIFLVYDVHSEESFDSVRGWVQQISEHASPHVVRMLLGNKCDADVEDRRVTKEQGVKLAEEYDIQFFETSAKLDVGIKEAFDAMARQVLAQTKAKQKQQQGHLFQPRTTDTKCCS